MKLQAFSVYDEKAQAYNTPFFQLQIAQAIRHFSDLSQDTKTTINRHPEDYSLYHIGEWDDDNASLTSFTEPRVQARASDYQQQPGEPSHA